MLADDAHRRFSQMMLVEDPYVFEDSKSAHMTLLDWLKFRATPLRAYYGYAWPIIIKVSHDFL